MDAIVWFDSQTIHFPNEMQFGFLKIRINVPNLDRFGCDVIRVKMDPQSKSEERL
jgi:hypothetical protein